MVGLIPGNFFHKLRSHNICSHHFGVGGNEDPAFFIGKKQVSLGALADDLQLGAQCVQLIAFRQLRLLDQILGRALGDAHHLIQCFVAVLGKVVLEQHPLRSAHQHDAQHHQGGHQREERHRDTFAHY